MERASSRSKKRRGREDVRSGSPLSINNVKSNADDALTDSQRCNADATPHRTRKKSKHSSRAQMIEQEPAEVPELRSATGEETDMREYPALADP